MPYASTITFTLDTICPWTYIALLRLQRALSVFSSDKVSFTLRFAPYQLYPEFSSVGEDKHAWYKREKYADDARRMDMFVAYMTQLFAAEDVVWTAEGTIANTLPAHRVVQCVQETKGVDAALKVVRSLYRQYFTEGLHPSEKGTLQRACVEAGVGEKEAETLVGDEYAGLMDVKREIQEQAGNGVDSVPYIVFEGRRRDFTLVGAKEVDEYVKTLEQVVKEA